MAGYTKNFNLKLPSDIEFYDIEDFNENFEKIDQMAVKKGEGIGELTGGALSDRPEPGIAGRYYFAQDTGEIFLDTGEEWVLAAASQKELAAHKAENVTNEGGAHGIEYEEGEWIPQFSTPDYTGGNEYSIQSGKYIRINNKVTLYGRMTLSKKSESLTGVLSIVGLPFIPSGSTRNALIISIINKLNIPLGAPIGGYRVNDYILLVQFNGTTVSNIRGQDLTDNTDISFVFEHFI